MDTVLFMGKIRLSHYTIRRSPKAGQPSGSVRIVLLADLHNHAYRTDVPSVLEEIGKERCDLVLSAGDLVLMKDGGYEYDQALKLVSSLSASVPVCVADGNHERKMKRSCPDRYAAYESALEEYGIIRLHNRGTDLTVNGLKLHVTGLELDYRYFRNRFHKDLSVEEIRSLVGEPVKDRLQILLAHHPKYFPQYARWGANLTVSGHLHGGIVRLPFLGGVISPDPELFPHYDHGLYREGDAYMVVSAGLGTHSINLRINNPCELPVIELIQE